MVSALASLSLASGDLERAEEVLADAEREPDMSGDDVNPYNLLFYITRPLLDLRRGNVEASAAAIQRVIDTCRERSALVFLPEPLLIKAQGLIRQGRVDEAQPLLLEATDIAEKARARRVWWQVLAERADLAAERGEHEEALLLRSQACEIVDYIAEHTGGPELRDSFLATAGVVRLKAHLGERSQENR